MTAVLKQASNNTGLSLTREASPNVVDATAKWYPQEPNSYKDFGANYKMVARNPINSSRQNKKGVITDLDSNGGWQEDITYPGVQNKIEGLMYADFRKKAELTVTGTTKSSGVYAVAAGGAAFVVGDMLFAKGFAVAANNGWKHVTAASATSVTVSETIGDEVSPPSIAQVVKVGHQFASGDLTYTASTKTFATTTFDLTTLGLIPGEWICTASDVPANDMGTNLGMSRVVSVTTNAIVVDKVQAIVPTSPITNGGAGKVGQLFFGRVVKNELDTAIKHYTYQAERTLGKDDSTATMNQVEYLTGCVINEAVFTVNSADKATCEWTLMGSLYETRVSAVGPKVIGTRVSLIEGSAFNTSTDISRLNLSLVGSDAPLYAYVMDCALTVNNGNKANKAVGVLGSIDHTESNFMVSLAITAYFANVTAATAISQNSNVTFDMLMARDNFGILFDVPLVTLGDGMPKITANEAIQLPLSVSAATAKLINPNTDYTLMLVFFDYLPSIVC